MVEIAESNIVLCQIRELRAGELEEVCYLQNVQCLQTYSN